MASVQVLRKRRVRTQKPAVSREGPGIRRPSGSANTKLIFLYGLTLVAIFVVARRVLIRNVPPPLDASKNQSEIGDIFATPTTRAFASAIKKSIGMINNQDSISTWKLVDWTAPITTEEEQNFICDFTTFQSASTGKTAPMCVHSFKNNKITINHKHVSFGLSFVLIYVVSRHQYSTWSSDTNDNKSQISGISATPAARAFASAIKKRIGTINNKGSNNTWKLIDWAVPITAEEYKKFGCDFTTFESVMTKKSAPMCVHSFPDIVSGYIRRQKRFGDCNVLPTIWNSSHGEQTDESVYIEIGANIGSC
eukprot:CAMPEP_0172522430 /NCGR_PEP_ID=MMETSP1066-20121228/293121_1 /TAXON_ID=671091 /ORGANISM="Coscinodiscus wailesii, Strain CCMP2513" /LENGTH=307 /DNA_ID=CAMNT_0013305429 /DNA_START=48 /DNA_END=968 /DNA_ORIENTATION=-